LKPTGSMEDMYGDKGGSCAVIGALKGTIEL
jgi:leucyl aminopeptidase